MVTDLLRRIRTWLRADFLSRRRHARPSLPDKLLKHGANERILSLPVAGVMHEGHEKTAVRLMLHEPVTMRREPANPFDPNAIAVVTKNGDVFGYVDRQDASLLAAWIDSKGGSIGASVSELAADPQGTFVGVRVSTIVPADIPGLPAAGIEFDSELGSGGGGYLFLDCDEAAVHSIRQELEACGLPSLRSGMSFHPCKSGRLYRWYVRMGEEVTPEAIRNFFAEKYQLQPGSREARAAIDQYARSFDKDLGTKEAEKNVLLGKVEDLETQLIEANRRERDAHGTAITRILTALFREIVLLRDSSEVICRELRCCDSILKALHEVACKPAALRAAAVRGADGWKEVHYSTGQKDHGRLYFKRMGDKVLALVSFKAVQAKDVEYLRKHH
jgi:hypothetical protein